MRLRNRDLRKYKSQSEQPKKLESKELEQLPKRKRLFPSFSLRDLPSLTMLFVVSVIVISVGSNILQEMNIENSSITLENATTEPFKSLQAMSNWLEIIGLVVAASVVIGILMVYFGGLIR